MLTGQATRDVIHAPSPLPWRQSSSRPHALMDATGEVVLMAYPVTGGPLRGIANLDLAERACNGHERLMAAAKIALAAMEEASRHRATGELSRAVEVLRRAIGEQAQATQTA